MIETRHESPASFHTVLNQIIAWLSQTDPIIPDWSSAEWGLFQQAAFIHGVAPLLHIRLINKQLPEQIADWLAWQYEGNRRRIQKIQSDLQAILAAFATCDIPLIPLKGAVLSAVYYEDIGLRPTADIDLLVQPKDFSQSLKIMAQLGYEVEKSNWKHAILSQPDNRTVVSYEVEHPDNPRRVDLHIACQEMFSGPLIDLTAEIWATATPGQLLGEQACVLSTEMLWLHLLLHTSSNLWNGVLRLINLIDIVQLEMSDRSNLSITREHNYSIDNRFLYPALLFCQRYFPQLDYQESVKQCRTAVPGSFNDWLTQQDLISRSRLREETKRDYLKRLYYLYRGRPKDILAAFRLLPSLLKSS